MGSVTGRLVPSVPPGAEGITMPPALKEAIDAEVRRRIIRLAELRAFVADWHATLTDEELREVEAERRKLETEWLF